MAGRPFELATIPRSRTSFPFALGAPIYKDDDDGEQRKGSSASGVPYYIFIIIFLERGFFFSRFDCCLAMAFTAPSELFVFLFSRCDRKRTRKNAIEP